MKDICWPLVSSAQLSILLEVSSPKPGNVNRLRRFSDTGYRHFLASASLMGRGLHLAATRGIQLANSEIQGREIGIGELILESSEDVFGGLNQSNTILGTILLYIPVVVATSAALSENKKLNIDDLQKWIKIILDSTSVEDTLNVYRAFHLANPSGARNKEEQTWTDIHDRYDIDNPRVLQNIRKDDLTLKKLFLLSADVEPISKEWSEYFQLTLRETYPYLDTHANSLENLEEGIVRTFTWLLSRQPDGLIIKKAGFEKAQEIQHLAEDVMKVSHDESSTEDLLDELDSILRSDGNTLNPGTTADMVSVAILLKLVSMTFNEI
ncbi:MAG: triphosphoribosyl-dephospho-CoA synthase [Candidatus Thorarchaeota archaeon]|nr:triphosphoribosyl-dephospho-CoA synthase [Candidatus Thorarchaeota archaeon]